MNTSSRLPDASLLWPFWQWLILPSLFDHFLISTARECHLLSLDILYNFGFSLSFSQFWVLVHQASSHRCSSISSCLSSPLPSGLQVHCFFIYCSNLNESVPLSSLISFLDAYSNNTCQYSSRLFSSLLQFLDWLYPQTRSFFKTAVALALVLTSL